MPVHLQRFLRLLRDHELSEEDCNKLFFQFTKASASVLGDDTIFNGSKVKKRI
ncbi:hypothetical protein ACJIZ3_016882 [Penstemon smallii]|uniref:Uncharacterized protein n=1 Tax=Penstemon smallii TaxID=265156 RepID=A0ABD3SU02_9LAMI